MWSIEFYYIDVTNEQFVLIDIVESGFKNLSYFNKKNGIGGASLDLNLFHPKAKASLLRRYRTQIIIKYNNSIEWFGFIDKVTFGYQDVEGTIHIEALSYFAHLANRYITASYSQQDGGDIVWDLIDTTQSATNGFLGITQGTIDTTYDHDRSYENKEVAEAIMQLSEVENGLAFRLTATQDSNYRFTGCTINVAPGYGSQRDDLAPLEIGVNVSSVDGSTQGDIVNYVTMYGAGVGQDVIYAN